VTSEIIAVLDKWEAEKLEVLLNQVFVGVVNGERDMQTRMERGLRCMRETRRIGVAALEAWANQEATS
jgi:hypothetical protein